jgi:hypothetical protein
VKPNLTPAAMNQLLRETATHFPGSSSCNTNICGAGIVNAFAAVFQEQVIPDEAVYMPLVRAPGTATPPTADPLDNPGFEAGPVKWTEFSSHDYDLILTTADLPINAHGGSWAAWLGGADAEISYIQQSVTIPSSKPYLHYWRWIASGDLCGFDKGAVLINSVPVATYDLCSDTETGGWQKQVVNLNSYKGQTVVLQIRAETDSSITSNLFIDDLTFAATAAATDAVVPAGGNPHASR